ncbi:cytochrome c1 [Modicisalibacter radicis]|uniref:cytochrome c1 n=1 Tax=Halomonas sp. EAR18 TaxID=2518972 RepID=UPI00109D17A5|nr:cytochrome c1 [Halomonas sp. EAR18]
MRRCLGAMLLSTALASASASASAGEARIDPMQPDLQDKASLQRGMKFFIDNCQSCHSLEYQRYSRSAEDLQLTREAMQERGLLPPGGEFHGPMRSLIPAEQAADWLGVAPPDLTFTARRRGSDWLYAFLDGFYRQGGPDGAVDNLVLPGVAMPPVLESMQGVQRRMCADGRAYDPDADDADACRRLQVVEAGSMTPEAFDRGIRDVSNFLGYVAEPSRLQAHRLAPKVLAFLAVFAFIAYLLKREYWRDID